MITLSKEEKKKMKKKLVIMVLVAGMVLTACGSKNTDAGDHLGAITVGGETVTTETQDDPWSNPGGEDESGIVYPSGQEALTNAEVYMDELYGKNQGYYQDLYDGQLLKVGSRYHIISNYVKQLAGGEEVTVENSDMRSVVVVGEKAMLAYSDSNIEVGDGEAVARFLGIFQSVMSDEIGNGTEIDAEIHPFTLPDDGDRIHYCIMMPTDNDGNATVLVLQNVGYETYMYVQVTDKTGKNDWVDIIGSYLLPSFNE